MSSRRQRSIPLGGRYRQVSLYFVLGIRWRLRIGDVMTSYDFKHKVYCTWWRHQMETFSVLLALCAGNSPVTGELPAQRPVTRSFDVFIDLRLNKRLRKQSWGWWFKTLSRPLWRHCNTQSCCKFCHHGHSVHEFITSPKLVWGALEIFDVAWYILQRECRWSRNWDPGRDPKSIFSNKKVITDSCCDIRFYSKTQFNPKSRWISYVHSIYFVCPIILKVCMVRPCSVHNFNDQSTTQEVMRNGVSQHWV